MNVKMKNIFPSLKSCHTFLEVHASQVVVLSVTESVCLSSVCHTFVESQKSKKSQKSQKSQNSQKKSKQAGAELCQAQVKLEVIV